MGEFLKDSSGLCRFSLRWEHGVWGLPVSEPQTQEGLSSASKYLPLPYRLWTFLYSCFYSARG